MELKELINNYLKTEKLMSIATKNGEDLWVANVYYLVNEDLNLYFNSKTHREHSKHIELDPSVAIGIADSSQPLAPGQKGIQLSGKASRVDDPKTLNWFADEWNKNISTAPGAEKLVGKELEKSESAGVYEIKPNRIKFFNTEIWPTEQYQVLNID